MDDSLKQVRDAIPGRMAAAGVPAVVIGVARGGEVLWEEGFGWADEARGLRSSPDVSYPVGSITKPITATALMILVERGLVELDRPINDYLGDAQLVAHVGSVREATVRRVAAHSAGLPLHYHFFYRDEPWQPPPMEVSVARYGHIVAPPGERFEYSNFGYGLLGRVVERVSGVSFPEFVRTELLEPLAMTRSAIGLPLELEEHAAGRYGPAGSPLPIVDADHRGGSAAYASARDLLRFGVFHLEQDTRDGEPLSVSGRLVMRSAGVDAGGGHGYGIGWRTLEDHNGHALVYHPGRMDGATCRLTLVPSEQTAVVVLTNSANDLCVEIVDLALRAVLPGFGAESSRTPRARRARKDRDWRGSLRRKLVGRWAGHVATYDGDRTIALTIGKRGPLVCGLGGQPETIVEEVSSIGDRLRGTTGGDIGTADAARRPYRLHLDLTLRDGRLCGSVTAVSEPGDRLGSALSYWCELARGPQS